MENTLLGTENDDYLVADGTSYFIKALGGNDTIALQTTAVSTDGGDGIDTVILPFSQAELTLSSAYVSSEYFENGELIVAKEQLVLNTIFLGTEEDGLIPFNNVEQFSFSNSDEIVSAHDVVTSIEENKVIGIPEPVPSYPEPILGTDENEVLNGTGDNDFFNLLGGDDAVNGLAGDDILDGDTGSNFLTGGSGADTFFIDGRSGGTTWSTITDFSTESGDSVNIWGWVAGTSRLLLSEAQAGAEGYTGITYHYDLNNDGVIDTSITFSGLTTETIAESSANTIGTTGYLLFA